MEMGIKNAIRIPPLSSEKELSHISNFFKTLDIQVSHLLKFLMQIYTKLTPKSIADFLNR